MKKYLKLDKKNIINYFNAFYIKLLFYFDNFINTFFAS